MTALFQARRRAEEFAAAVDGSSGNSTLHDDLAPMLEVVSTLRSQEPVAPRAEFASDLRTRLMVEAEAALHPASAQLRLPARERGKRERRLVAAASAFVLIGGSTTMAAAAQNALPGEALYPIKRGIERAEAGLSLSDAGRGRDLLSQATSRLSEVERLVADGSAQNALQVPSTIAAYAASADQGSSLLFDSFRAGSEPEDIVAVRTFAADGIEALQGLAGVVPDAAQKELAAAAVLLSEIDRQAAALCDTCSPDLPVAQVPGIFLARAEVDRALALAATRDLFNNHPVEVSKEAVERVRSQTLADGGTTAEDAGSVSAPQSTPLPVPTAAPESWPSLLPGLDAGTSGTKQKSGTGGVVEDTSKNLADSLDETVETLLPDLGDGDLLD